MEGGWGQRKEGGMERRKAEGWGEGGRLGIREGVREVCKGEGRLMDVEKEGGMLRDVGKEGG